MGQLLYSRGPPAHRGTEDVQVPQELRVHPGLPEEVHRYAAVSHDRPWVVICVAASLPYFSSSGRQFRIFCLLHGYGKPVDYSEEHMQHSVASTIPPPPVVHTASRRHIRLRMPHGLLIALLCAVCVWCASCICRTSVCGACCVVCRVVDGRCCRWRSAWTTFWPSHMPA